VRIEEPPVYRPKTVAETVASLAGGGTPAGGAPVYQMPQPGIEEEGIRPRMRTVGQQFSLQDIIKSLRGALAMTQQVPLAGAIAPPGLAGQRFVPRYNPALQRQMPDTRLALLRSTGLPQQIPTGAQPPAQPRLQPPTPYYGRSAIPGYVAPNQPAPKPYEWTGAVTKEWGGPPKMGTVTPQSFLQSLPAAKWFKWFNTEPERTAEAERMTPADYASAARYSAAAAEWMADYARQLEDALKNPKPAGRYGYWYPYWGYWGWGGGGGGGGRWGGGSQRAAYYYNPLMNWNI
jgi:hypothetical protein